MLKIAVLCSLIAVCPKVFATFSSTIFVTSNATICHQSESEGQYLQRRADTGTRSTCQTAFQVSRANCSSSGAPTPKRCPSTAWRLLGASETQQIAAPGAWGRGGGVPAQTQDILTSPGDCGGPGTGNLGGALRARCRSAVAPSPLMSTGLHV